jgi:hypothetical protein
MGGFDASADDASADSPSNGDDAGFGVACGASTCTPRTQTCCVGQTNTGIQTTCVDGTMCPTTGATTLRCTSSDDCSGSDVCCLSQVGGGAVAECKASCGVAVGNSNGQLCDLNAFSSGCPQGQQCQDVNVPLPDGLGVCR